MDDFKLHNDIKAELKICDIRDTCAERDSIIKDCWAIIEKCKDIIKNEADRAAAKIILLEKTLRFYFNMTVQHFKDVKKPVHLLKNV